MENEFETIDSLNNETEEVTNDNQQPEVDVEKLKETNSKLYARAKEAEAELKKLRSQPKPAQSVPSTNANYVSREELDLAILRTSKGYDDESIDNLQVISKGKGISLIQAQEDPLFKLMLEKKELDMRKAQSNLGASKGSTSNQARKIAEMTRDEHRAYVAELAQ